ncbi:MAG: FHA domain-containing protein [Vicinamibacterales bacterium]
MRYAFGACRLDTVSRELTRDGQAVHVTPKTFELLKLLIDERPRVLAKNELMERLWPDAFVVEANLPVLVGDLRTALGDHSSLSSMIKTHHGIGYSFAADVRELTSGAAAAEQSGPRSHLRFGVRRVALGQGPNTVGRDAEADVYVNDASVSRHHARITIHGVTAHVEDLDSKNGTWVADARIDRPTLLLHGAIVMFGSVEAVFLIDKSEDPTTQTL